MTHLLSSHTHTYGTHSNLALAHVNPMLEDTASSRAQFIVCNFAVCYFFLRFSKQLMYNYTALKISHIGILHSGQLTDAHVIPARFKMVEELLHHWTIAVSAVRLDSLQKFYFSYFLNLIFQMTLQYSSTRFRLLSVENSNEKTAATPS